MKKFIILTGIALLAVTSCARDEIRTVNKGHAIDFKVVETKGDVMQYASDLRYFHATAFNMSNEDETLAITPYFSDVYFGRLGDYFTSSPIYYWPTDESVLFFFAYTPDPSESGATVSISTGDQEITGFAPATDISEQVDLMTASGIGNSESETSGVDLAFCHSLARVQVRAYENNSAYDYSVAGVKLANFGSEGNLKMTSTIISGNKFQMNHEWTLAENKIATYLLEYDSNPFSVNSGYNSMMYNDNPERNYNDALIIPQTLNAWNPESDLTNADKGAYIGLKIRITATASGTQVFPATAGEYGWVAVPVPDGLTLEDGNTYYFNLNLTYGAGYTDPEEGTPEKVLGDDIIFTVKVNEIDDASGSAIITKELEGHWLAKRADITYVKNDNYQEGMTDRTDEVDYREGEEALRNWFGSDGFYEFYVDNNYNLTVVTPAGYVVPSSFTVDDDNNIYLEAFKKADGTYPRIKIWDINQEEQTCITLVIDDNYYNGFDRYVYYTYDRK